MVTSGACRTLYARCTSPSQHPASPPPPARGTAGGCRAFSQGTPRFHSKPLPRAAGEISPFLSSHRTARASAGPIFKGVCKQFSRSQGHGFITPENGTEDIFVHVSE